MGVGDGGVTSASARVRRMPVRCLAPQTWSVPDFVRTDLRTVRLAIACSDRSHRALHPRKSQTVTPNSPPGGGSEQAWKEHHMSSCSPNAHTEVGEEGYAHRSCAPGVRTRDQSNCEIKGGAPSTG